MPPSRRCSHGGSCGTACRFARPSEPRRAPARSASTAARRAKVDPALASRVETAATRVTGMAARVTGGRLEIAFADETELEELAEALERVSD